MYIMIIDHLPHHQPKHIDCFTSQLQPKAFSTTGHKMAPPQKQGKVCVGAI